MFVCLFLGTFPAFSAIIGEFDQVQNLPGYISFDPKEPEYHGVYTSPSQYMGAERRTPSKILAQYFVDGQLDLLLLQGFINDLKDYRAAIKVSICMEKMRDEFESYEQCQGKIDSKKFKKKWKKNKFNIALKFAIAELEAAKVMAKEVSAQNINSMQARPFLERFFNAQEVYQAIRAEDEQRGKHSRLYAGLLQAKVLIFDNDAIKSNRMHATNLLDESGHFLSQQALKTLKSQGVDLSTLDPPSSGLWRKPKNSIKSFDTSNYNKSGLGQLEALVGKKLAPKVLDPEEVINVIYKPHYISGGMTPKFDVYINDEKFKLKFITNRGGYHSQSSVIGEIMKYFWGSEVNSEPVVNNLAAALGFTVDPTYYKKKVRVYFEDEVYEKGEFEKILKYLVDHATDRFPGVSNIKSAFEMIKTDSNGKKYVEMKSVSLESKSDRKSDMNIGFFVRDGMGKSLKREHRAFSAFLAWILDVDIKDDNDKVKIVPVKTPAGEITYKVMFSNSDMGGSLGLGFPNIYNLNFVSKVKRNRANEVVSLDLNFLKIWPFPLAKAVNIDDVKWIARRMAQLSEEQIVQAFLSGGYPEVVSKYYALLMLKKRNALLEALDMVGERFIDDGGKPFEIVKSNEFEGTIAGYEEFFRNGHLTDPENKLFDPSQENWPRYWGVSWRNRDTEIPQQQMLKTLRQNVIQALLSGVKSLALDQMLIGDDGVSFFNAEVFDRDLGAACQGQCFMQALDFGARHFTPMRYLVQNNDDTAENPLYQVDVFRVGTYLGTNGLLLQSVLGFDFPSFIRGGMGQRFFRIMEFMRVRPIQSVEEYYHQKHELMQLPKNISLDYRLEMIKQLDQGDALLVNHYVGQKLGARIRPVMYYPLASLRMGVENINLRRMTFLKQKENKLLAHWGNGKNLTSDFAINGFDLLLRLPLFRVQQQKLVKNDHTYLFDLNNSKEVDVLRNGMGKVMPEILEEYLLRQRLTKQKSKFMQASLFGFLSKNSYKKMVTNKFYDHKLNQMYQDKSYTIERESTKFTSLTTFEQSKTATALLNNKKEVYLKFNLNWNHPSLRKPQYLNMVREQQGILPEDLMAFDPTYIKYYMGQVEMNVDIFFNNQFVDEFFDQEVSKFDFCVQYADFMQQEDPKLSCGFTNGSSYKVLKSFRRALNKLWRGYSDARTRYRELKRESFNESRFKTLKKLAKFIVGQPDSRKTIKFMLSRAKPEQFKRNVKIDSSLYAFPGDIREIKESNLKAGQAEIYQRPPMELFIDNIDDHVEQYFFNNRFSIVRQPRSLRNKHAEQAFAIPE